MVRSRGVLFLVYAPQIISFQLQLRICIHIVMSIRTICFTVFFTLRLAFLVQVTVDILGVINSLLINTFILPYILNVTTPRMNHGGMGRCIQLVCVTDWGVSIFNSFNLSIHFLNLSTVLNELINYYFTEFDLIIHLL